MEIASELIAHELRGKAATMVGEWSGHQLECKNPCPQIQKFSTPSEGPMQIIHIDQVKKPSCHHNMPPESANQGEQLGPPIWCAGYPKSAHSIYPHCGRVSARFVAMYGQSRRQILTSLWADLMSAETHKGASLDSTEQLLLQLGQDIVSGPCTRCCC